jgi:hypothetical protein
MARGGWRCWRWCLFGGSPAGAAPAAARDLIGGKWEAGADECGGHVKWPWGGAHAMCSRIDRRHHRAEPALRHQRDGGLAGSAAHKREIRRALTQKIPARLEIFSVSRPAAERKNLSSWWPDSRGLGLSGRSPAYLPGFLARFSVKGVQKHHKNVLQKVHFENFIRKKSKVFQCQFFSLNFFGFIAFSGASQRREFKNTTKIFCKKIVSKSFYNKSTKNPKPTFSRFFLSRFLGVSR